MTDKHNARDDLELEQMFRDARAQPMLPSEDLMARMMADMTALQPKIAPENAATAPTLLSRLSGWVPQLAWPAGLAMAGLTGVWIGSGTVPVLSDQAQSLLSSDLAYELAFRMPSLTAYIGGQ